MINDTHRHDIGDLVLKETAKRIKGQIREADTVARIGGDEFVIIASRLPEISIAERIAACLIEKVSNPIHIEQIQVAVSTSIGIALYPRDGDTAEQLVSVADKAMYAVKHSGKNNFAFTDLQATGESTT